MMDNFLLSIAIIITLICAVCLYRVVAGPTVFDRIIAAGVVGTNGLILLALIGFLYHRIDMFIDLAIVYALLTFVGTIAIGKYFERGGQKPR